MRSGLLARKLGMSHFYDDHDIRTPVTVLQIDAPQVVDLCTIEKNGYMAVKIGAGNQKPQRMSKALKGIYHKANIQPKAILKEYRVSRDALLSIGDELLVSHFVINQWIDVTAISIGKGFAGGMKRHNFGGLRASHGVSISHRSHGSTGQCQDPGRVFKGKKMAGHLGFKQITVQNLKLVKIDEQKKLILVKGSIPGHNGCWVSIRDAVKKYLPDNVPYPAGLKRKN